MKDISAFPGIETPGGGYAGMTLRDYFAGQALIQWRHTMDEASSYLQCAEWCYEMADAMLKAREMK